MLNYPLISRQFLAATAGGYDAARGQQQACICVCHSPCFPGCLCPRLSVCKLVSICLFSCICFSVFVPWCAWHFVGLAFLLLMSVTLELCADVIVSAVARRSISVGGGGAAQRGRPKTFFFKIHEKISFYPQHFLRNFFSHQSFEVCKWPMLAGSEILKRQKSWE